MLDWDITRWVEELDVAEGFRDRHLSHWDTIIDRMTGPDYRDEGDSAGDPENFVHQYVALILPRLVFDNPRIRISSRTPMDHLLYGKQMQAAINSWCKSTRMRDTLQRIATDMLVAYGVGMVVNEPMSSMRQVDGDTPWLPRLYRIDPHDFIIDPQARHLEDTRYMAHVYRCDRDDLLERAEVEDGWDVSAIEHAAGHTEADIDEFSGERSGPDRDQLTIYEIWVPELRGEEEIVDEMLDTDMHSGSILTIIRGQARGDDPATMGFARKPRAYYGPRNGPYQVFGCYSVPNDPYPLSPIVPLLPQIADINDHLRSMTHSAAVYKRIIATDSRNQKLANDIRDREDLTVVLSDGLDPSQIVPIELGGITPQQVNYAGLTQDRLDRVSGIHDAMRGNVTGTATATEINVAESAAGLRIAHLKKEFQEAVSRALGAVCWYLFHDARVAFAVGDSEASPMLGMNPIFRGGTGAGLYEDMVVSVDAMSMSRVSETQQQKRAIELLQVIGGLSQQMVAAPWVDWQQVLDTVGDSLNVPELGTMLDPKRLEQMAQQQAAAGAGAGRPASGTVSPGPSGGQSIA
tara:strand:+ start:255 stop:1982 length:1728 start_codon:yes stop_codon:yes gene_type:complete